MAYRSGIEVRSSIDATWAASRLDEHNQRRQALGLRVPGSAIYHSPYDSNPDRPPPALEPHGGDRPPSSTPDRWASRFRDGKPPPPPPPPPVRQSEVAAVLQAAGLDPSSPQSIERYRQGVLSGHYPAFEDARKLLGLTREHLTLKPQALLDRPSLSGGESGSQQPVAADPDLLYRRAQRRLERYQSPSPGSVLRPESATATLVPEEVLSVLTQTEQTHAQALPGASSVMAQSSALTPSQKRRQRRRRSREIREGTDSAFPPSHKPTPDQPSTNGHTPYPTDPRSPPRPNPDIPPQPHQCGHASRVYLPTISQWIELVCTVEMVPHPNQPHLLQVPPSYLDGAGELFIGWFGPGE